MDLNSAFMKYFFLHSSSSVVLLPEIIEGRHCQYMYIIIYIYINVFISVLLLVKVNFRRRNVGKLNECDLLCITVSNYLKDPDNYGFTKRSGRIPSVD
uniref:Uncharacterized protein n=1 Tax=Glossina palpalis gambiensis TaxID=67801 RepID=A0A1B0B6Y4_9MUSC